MSKHPMHIHLSGNEEPSSAQMEPFPHASHMPHMLSLDSERVRFAAAVTLEQEGVDQPLSGWVVNLSTQGVCCYVQQELPKGRRVWVNMRLQAASEPVSLVGEIVWTKSVREGVEHGIRFLSVPEHIQSLLAGLVAERTEGVASEWTLPNIPSLADLPEVPPMLVSKKRTATAVAAGVCFGLGLALLWISMAPETVAWLNPVRQAVLAWVSGG